MTFFFYNIIFYYSARHQKNFKCVLLSYITAWFLLQYYLHITTAQIEARVDELGSLWERLVQASELKGSKLQEAAAQQQFNRASEDIELWLSEVEGQLLSEDYGKVRFWIFSYRLVI